MNKWGCKYLMWFFFYKNIYMYYIISTYIFIVLDYSLQIVLVQSVRDY